MKAASFVQLCLRWEYFHCLYPKDFLDFIITIIIIIIIIIRDHCSHLPDPPIPTRRAWPPFCLITRMILIIGFMIMMIIDHYNYDDHDIGPAGVLNSKSEHDKWHRRLWQRVVLLRIVIRIVIVVLLQIFIHLLAAADLTNVTSRMLDITLRMCGVTLWRWKW